MADFCVQCATAHGFGTGDLAGLLRQEDWNNGLAVWVICEGCGETQVDPTGRCIRDDCLEKHGEKK